MCIAIRAEIETRGAGLPCSRKKSNMSTGRARRLSIQPSSSIRSDRSKNSGNLINEVSSIQMAPNINTSAPLFPSLPHSKQGSSKSSNYSVRSRASKNKTWAKVQRMHDWKGVFYTLAILQAVLSIGNERWHQLDHLQLVFTFTAISELRTSS
jgi:hypothetical protein